MNNQFLPSQTMDELISHMIDLGVDAKRNGEYSKALDYYNKALKLDPHHFEALYARAKIYYIISEFERSAIDYGKCAQIYLSGYANINASQALRDPSFIQIALHCGHSLMAKLARYEKMETLIIFSNEYRRKLDPYYDSSAPRIRYLMSDFELFQEKCLDEGLFYLKGLFQ